jgi:hypothetical protein
MPVLERHQLAWQTFPTTMQDGDGQLKPALRYVLTHAISGEAQMDTMLLMMDTHTSQAQGSALTYARRYALQAVLELAPDGDDDGAAASQPARPAPVDPERPMGERNVEAMLEAIAERGLSREIILGAAGVEEGRAPTIAQGRRVKEALDAHDAAQGVA